MYARVSIYEVPQDRRGEAEASFASALTRIREVDGLQKAQFFLGCDSERAVTITFWESQGAMAASRVAASRLRSDAASSVDGDVLSVEEFQVVVDE